ncbi:MAG: 50S ribosomal protein L9 [Magnetococcales bacterium]|nr:50S ribosomal protein L9 [Magnetococcales bacterium]MBF0149448.1 50S ribosomal protein L9 [Magnetococcales bacterium]MBF0171889.1 50S ribosomal protein L9 [Magnetococcales bacterium]MBF0346067.1 50S ribosomal protein L9 [Magnetococcales bacterium]MBF0632290.1 50S ribosomal protein L9 [Magnetococcales bacterium]
MEVILLEKIGRVGNLGEQVKVRGGYGRNYLIPQGKALPATRENMQRFEQQKAEFQKRQEEILATAKELATQIEGIAVVLDRPAGTTEKLFGSVTNADISSFYKEKGLDIPRSQIDVPHPIRVLGEHTVRIRLHPDVIPVVKVVVERRVNS